ncbi:unnamed protein product [Ectocarpus sp. 12 AP-2014]
MDTMDTDALLGMSLDEMLAAKPKKKVNGGGRGGKVRNTGRASRQQQSQPYRQPAPKGHVGGGSNNRVYVGNLAWTVTWKELKDLMSTCGPCKAEVPCGADGRSRVSWRRRRFAVAGCWGIGLITQRASLSCVAVLRASLCFDTSLARAAGADLGFVYPRF